MHNLVRVGVAAATVLLASTAVPALSADAAVSKSVYIQCPPSAIYSIEMATIVVKASGDIQLTGDVRDWWIHGPDFYSSYSYTNLKRARVNVIVTGGMLDDHGTYGYCRDF